MTAAASPNSTSPSRFRNLISATIVLAIIGGAIALAPGTLNFDAIAVHAHAPDWSLLARSPVAIQIHLAAALAALLLGVAQFALPKGTGLHRTLGWAWVVLIGAAAVSSLFIRLINNGAFSLIHILSAWTLLVLPMAVYAARRGDIARHRGRMTGLFIGGLLIAGTLAFMPGRLMWRLFFGN